MTAHVYKLVWHWFPLYPGTQLHVNMLTPSTHVAPFWHGLLRQSLISGKNNTWCVIFHVIGVYVITSRRACEINKQNKLHPLVWHRTPVYPGTQLHEYMLTKSLHVAPFWQGVLAHSLMSVQQTIHVKEKSHPSMPENFIDMWGVGVWGCGGVRGIQFYYIRLYQLSLYTILNSTLFLRRN